MKTIQMLATASGYACEIAPAGAAQHAPSERARFSRGNILSALWKGITHAQETTSARPAVMAEEEENFPGVELAASDLGICPMKLQDVVSGWIENPLVLGIWKNWLKSRPDFHHAYTDCGLIHGACEPVATTIEVPISAPRAA